jgi:2',3'-cyclic-nucleotide 2'-phosphodiesterase (5'-nucleotidase family)
MLTQWKLIKKERHMMKNKKMLSLLCVTILVVSAFVGCSKEPKRTEPVDLTILHINDTHSRVEEGAYAGMGLARIATYVEEFRKSENNVLLLDGGDTFHGQTFSTLLEGESIVMIMNEMKFDAMAPGNHDFNYGVERLHEIDESTNFPILAANVKEQGENSFLANKIFEMDGIKVGVFGLATPETAYKTHPDNVKGVEFENPVEVAKEQVNELKDQVDIIVAITHIGLDEASQFTSKKLAEEVDGIDVIVDAHSHTPLKKGMVVNGTLIAQTGEYAKNLGIITIHIPVEGEIEKSAALISKEDSMDIPENKAILDIISEIKADIDKVTSVVVAQSDKNLNGEREFVRTGETNLANLITASMIEETGADVAITNGGGIRSSIRVGDVTKGDIITVLPFGNYVVTKKVKGQDILDAIEHGLSAYPEPEGSFPQIGGMTVVFDSAKPAGDRVVEIKIGDEILDLNKDYILATNDFMAAGGDDYTMFADDAIYNEYQGLDEILIKYMKSNGTDGAVEDNRIRDISGKQSLIINIAA